MRAAIAFALVLMYAAPAAAIQDPAAFIGQGNPTGTTGNWCADFVRFIYGKDLPVKPSRSAKQLYNRFKAAGRLTTDPKPGDLFFQWREKKTSWKGHVGIIESVGPEGITTIEGNKSGKVRRIQYTAGIPRLLGYGRIK